MNWLMGQVVPLTGQDMVDAVADALWADLGKYILFIATVTLLIWGWRQARSRFGGGKAKL